MKLSGTISAILVLLSWGAGCAAPSMTRSETLSATSAQLEVSVDRQEHPRLDRWESVLESPRRWLEGKSYDDSRETISPATLALVQDFLAEQGVTDIHVTVNTYEPAAEWARLRSNTTVSPLWRYTAGSLSVLKQALVPDRVTDRNSYNSYTKTLAINQDRPFAILSAAAYAARLEGQQPLMVGLKAAQLPLWKEVHQFQSSRDVLAYARTTDRWDLEQEGYLEFYPQVASSSVMLALPLVPWYVAPILGAGGHWVGHRVARAQIASRVRERSLTGASEVVTDAPVPGHPGDGSFQSVVPASLALPQ